MSGRSKHTIGALVGTVAIAATVVAGGAFSVNAQPMNDPSVQSVNAGEAIIVTDANWDQVMAATSNRTLILVFKTVWCGACKEMAPIIERMAAQSGGKWQLGYIDDEKVAKARPFNVPAYPTEIAFLGGKEISRKVYMDSEEDLLKWINEQAAKAPGGGVPGPGVTPTAAPTTPVPPAPTGGPTRPPRPTGWPKPPGWPMGADQN